MIKYVHMHILFPCIQKRPANETVLAPTKPDLEPWGILGLAYWIYIYIYMMYFSSATFFGDIPVACRSANTQNGPTRPLFIPDEPFEGNKSDCFQP